MSFTRAKRSARFFNLDQETFSLVERWRKEFQITSKESRLARRDRQTREFESNQKGLRESIAESNRLVDEANVMIQRHRDECDGAEGK